MTRNTSAWRGSQAYTVTVGALAVLALTISGILVAEAVPDRQTPSGPTSAAGVSGYGLAGPESLQDLAATSEIVVQGQLGKRLEVRDVSFGTSSPLGPDGVRRELTIRVARYELQVDRYLTGSGPDRLVFEEAVGAEGSGTRPGTEGIFFLSPASAWGPEGYSSHFGPKGGLTTRDGTVFFAGGDGGLPVPFLAGKSLDEVAVELAALGR